MEYLKKEIRTFQNGKTVNDQFYIDDGFSGTNFERPQFKQMIEDAQKGTVKRIICKDLSRFGRDYIKVGLYTETLWTRTQKADRETGC